MFGEAAVMGRAASRSRWHPLNYIVRENRLPNSPQGLLVRERY